MGANGDADNAVTAHKKPIEISPAFIVVTLTVLAGAGIFAWLSLAPRPGPPPKPTLTAEARAYLPNLTLSDVLPQTSESYIQKSLFEIIGKVSNTGPKSVTGVQVTCVFRNYNGQEIKRELVSIIGPRAGSLTPKATKSFRLAFDDVPDEWNHQLPDFVIAQISFE